jgi:hypothetical protein
LNTWMKAEADAAANKWASQANHWGKPLHLGWWWLASTRHPFSGWRNAYVLPHVSNITAVVFWDPAADRWVCTPWLTRDFYRDHRRATDLEVLTHSWEAST